MRKLIFLLLALALIISMAACSAGDPPAEPSGTTTAPTDITEPAPTAGPEDTEREQRQLFYDFLKTIHIPEVGLADLSKLSWTASSIRGGVEDDPRHLVENGRGGLLSAVVRDFDLDGTVDMVTFYMEEAPYDDTWKGIYDGERSVYRVSMSLYTLDGGNVVLSDRYHCLNLLDGDSWGHIQIRMELMEEGIYISSHSYAEDYSTYGASPTTIFHVADKHFVFDYIGGIHYGQASIDENPNLLLGTTNINPQDYTIRSISKAAADTDPNGDPEENRWIYYGKFENTDWSTGTMVYTGTDYTGLRIILDQGIDAFPHAPLPQGGIIPEHPSVQLALEAAQSIADHAAQLSGCTIINATSNYSEYSNTTTVRFETEEYTFLGFTYDADTLRLLNAGVSTNDYPVPQEWFDIKDALLTYEEFGLNADELSPFLGKKISYNKHMNGTPITGATVTILQVTDTSFSIRFPE